MAHDTKGSRIGGWLFLFIPALLFLAVFLVYSSNQSFSKAGSAKPLDPAWYKIETARGKTLTQQPMVGNCFLCHAYWVQIPRSNQTSKPRFAHANIVLNHGSNDRCYNCHHISNRNKYVADDGSQIMAQLPQELCKRCHGLIYKDWQLGTHGKVTGRWQVKNKGDKQKAICTACHDPHNPKFKYTVLAPPPVWPDKYLRTPLEQVHGNSLSGFLIGSKPKEKF